MANFENNANHSILTLIFYHFGSYSCLLEK